MKRISEIVALLSLAAAARAQTAALPVGLTNIGVAAAVRGVVHAAPPGQTVGRVIGSGQPVYLNDHVTTGPDGRLQLLLLDQTTFTIGPNSDMVLDEFVYDPKTGLGKVSAQILKGFFRFVTGKIAQARPSSMKVVLPVGTIGIRGTMVVGRVDGKDAEIVLIGPGYDNNANERRGGITVFNGKGSTDINSSGFGVRIKDGGAPGRGFRVSQTELETILGELSPKYASGRGGPPDASQTSGDSMAQGGINYHSWSNLNTINTSLNQTAAFASQAAAGSSCNGTVDCWSDLTALPYGNSRYDMSGTFNCTGGGCTEIFSGSGSFTANVIVNFNTKTITNGTEFTISSGDGYDQANLANAIAFGSNGKAIVTLTSAQVQGNYGFGDFGGTTLTFLKSGGAPAGAMQVNFNYNISGSYGGGTATGTSTATRQPYSP
jgi:hypothetical protein